MTWFKMIFCQCAQSAIPILIVMPTEERWDRISAQQWVADKMAFITTVGTQLPPPPPPPSIFW